MAATGASLGLFKVKGEVNVGDYMFDDPKESALATRFTKRQRASSEPRFELKVQSSFGCVFGIMYGRHWSFYLQQSIAMNSVHFVKKDGVSEVENHNRRLLRKRLRPAGDPAQDRHGAAPSRQDAAADDKAGADIRGHEAQLATHAGVGDLSDADLERRAARPLRLDQPRVGRGVKAWPRRDVALPPHVSFHSAFESPGSTRSGPSTHPCRLAGPSLCRRPKPQDLRSLWPCACSIACREVS